MTRSAARRPLPVFWLAACAILLCLPGLAMAAASGDAPDGLETLLARDVVLIGETHGSSASLELAGKLVAAAARRRTCVTLALEIGHGQQPALDAALRGAGSMEDVGLLPAIGHPAYRSWLSGLSRAVPPRSCFRVLAADLPQRQPGDRDRAMAGSIAQEVAAGRFVIGLFGALHVSRGVSYRYSPHHSAADYLARRGISAYSVLDSHAAACGAPGLRAPGSAEAAAAIEALRQTVNGAYPGNPARIVDAVWFGAGTACSTSAVPGNWLN